MTTTKNERERLAEALLRDAPDLVEAVIDALVAAGASPDWDSGTIEAVLAPLQDFVVDLGFPPVGSTGAEDEHLMFWQTVEEQ